MSDNCPVCNTPWTETQLITSSIKHCKVCNEKASVIMAKHKKKQKYTYPNIDMTKYTPGGAYLNDPVLLDIKTGKRYEPKKDPNCPVVTKKDGKLGEFKLPEKGDVYPRKEEFRSAREEIDYLYDKWQESKL